MIDKLTENNVPTGGILNMKEVFEQKASEELIIEGSLANGKRITGLRTIAFQSNFMNFNQELSSPPRLNEHAKKILSEDLKYNAEKIKDLKRKGAIMWV